MRRIFSLLLATGIALHVRWLPSERNPSNTAGRGERGLAAGVTDVHNGRVIAAARGPEADAVSDTGVGAELEARIDGTAARALRCEPATSLVAEAEEERGAVARCPA